MNLLHPLTIQQPWVISKVRTEVGVGLGCVQSLELRHGAKTETQIIQVLVFASFRETPYHFLNSYSHAHVASKDLARSREAK